MAHIHLQLFAHRFNELVDEYARRVSWISADCLVQVDNLQRSIGEFTSGKEVFVSCRSLVFDDVDFSKEILHFFRPIVCCGKVLKNTNTLMEHFLSNDCHGADSELGDNLMRLIVMFNLYVQLASGILLRYDNNYERVDQRSVEYLRKTHEYLSSIRGKPVRNDAIAAGTFVRATFSKWKYVFDYTCGACCDQGHERCRFPEAIAWYKVFGSTLAINAIRHMESKMHAESIRGMPADRAVVENLTSANQNNNNNNNDVVTWSEAAKYLISVRDSELDKMCATATQVRRTTPFEKMLEYLTEQLSAPLGGLTVHPFGSRMNELANPDSDLDILIRSRSGQREQTTYAKVLEWAEGNTEQVQVLRKIPAGPLLVRVFVIPLNLTLDLTFGNPYVVANSSLISCFLESQPLARKLFFLVKEWKLRSGISQNFHHHVILMLIIFYMQMKRFLPSVRPLLIGPPMINGAYNTRFCPEFRQMLSPSDILSLAKGFFAYWAKFDWTRNGICAFDAEVCPKETFRFASERQSVPPMMASDYFDRSRNVAGNIQANDYRKFVVACQEAVEVLKLKTTM